MKFTKEDLQWAISQQILSEQQANNFWKALEQRKQDKPKFDLPHVAYYFGAIIVMVAMGWFMTEAWNRFGGTGLSLIALIYAIGFILAGHNLWYKEKQKVPGGLLFTLAVWMVPLIIFGVEKATGMWPQDDPGMYRDYHYWVKGSWILMEIGTIIAGCLALKYIRFPFLTFPVAFSLWYLSMDLTPLLFGKQEFSWNERLYVSMLFGLAILLVSYLVDRKTKEDFAFWGYLFGLLAFWGGLSILDKGGEFGLFIYCLINLGLVIVSILFQRKVFIVFGSLGVIGYLGHLAYEVFKDSLLFPFALCILGILIIYLGLQYQKNYSLIEARLNEILPKDIKRLLPPERG